MHILKLAVDTSSTHSNWQIIVYYVVQMIVFFCSANMVSVSFCKVWPSEMTTWCRKNQ